MNTGRGLTHKNLTLKTAAHKRKKKITSTILRVTKPVETLLIKPDFPKPPWGELAEKQHPKNKHKIFPMQVCCLIAMAAVGALAIRTPPPATPSRYWTRLSPFGQMHFSTLWRFNGAKRTKQTILDVCKTEKERKKNRNVQKFLSFFPGAKGRV